MEKYLEKMIDKEIKELQIALINTQGLSDYLVGRLRGSLETLQRLKSLSKGNAKVMACPKVVGDGLAQTRKIVF